MTLMSNVLELKKRINQILLTNKQYGDSLNPLISSLDTFANQYDSFISKYDELLEAQAAQSIILDDHLASQQNETNQYYNSQKHQINLRTISTNKSLSKQNEYKVSLYQIISSLEQQQQTKEQQLDDALRHLENDLNRQLGQLTLEKTNIKKSTTDKNTKLANAQSAKIASLEQSIITVTQNAKAQIDDKTLKTNEKIAKLNQELAAYKQRADENYLQIKNVFFLETNTFNDTITKLDLAADEKIALVEKEYHARLDPIREQIIATTKVYDNLEVATKKDYSSQLEKNHTLLTKLEKNYEAERTALIKNLQEITSSAYAKLANLKDHQHQQRAELKKSMQEKAKNVDFDQQTHIKKDYQKLILNQEKELKLSSVETQKNLLKHKTQTNLKLLELEKQFIFDKAKWRADHTSINMQYRLSLQNIAARKQQKLNEFNFMLKIEGLTKDAQVAAIRDANHQEISPLEAKLTSFNYVSEKETQVLNYDFSTMMQTNQKNIEIAQLMLEHAIEAINYERDLKIAQLTLEINLAKSNALLGTQTNDTQKDSTCAKCDLKMDLAKATYELHVATEKDQFAQFITSITNNKEIARIKTDLLSQEVLALNHLTLAILKEIANHLDHKNTYESELLFVSKFVTLDKFALAKMQLKTIQLFDREFAIIKVMLTFYDQFLALYALPAKPDDLVTYLSCYLDFIQIALKISHTNTQEYLNFFISYIDDMIDENAQINITSELRVLQSDVKAQVLTLSDEENQLEEKNKEIERLILVNHSAIAKITEQINALKTESSLTKEKQAKADIASQINGLSSEISTLKTTHKTLEANIAKNNKRIIKINKQIDLINNQFAKAEGNLTQLHKHSVKEFHGLAKQVKVQIVALQNMTKAKILAIDEFIKTAKEQTYLTNDYFESTNKSFKSTIDGYEQSLKSFLPKLNNLITYAYNCVDLMHQKNEANIQKKDHSLSVAIENLEQSLADQTKTINLQTEQAIAKNETLCENALIKQKDALARQAASTTKKLKEAISLIEAKIAANEQALTNDTALVQANLNSVCAQYESEQATKQTSLKEKHGQYVVSYEAAIKAAEAKIKSTKEYNDQKTDYVLQKFNEDSLAAAKRYELQLANLVKVAADTQAEYEQKIQNAKNDIANSIKQLSKDLTSSSKAFAKKDKQNKLREESNAKKAYADAKKSHNFKKKTLTKH